MEKKKMILTTAITFVALSLSATAIHTDTNQPSANQSAVSTVKFIRFGTIN